MLMVNSGEGVVLEPEPDNSEDRFAGCSTVEHSPYFPPPSLPPSLLAMLMVNSGEVVALGYTQFTLNSTTDPDCLKL